MGFFSALLHDEGDEGWMKRFLCSCPPGVHHQRDSSSGGLLCKKKTAAVVSSLALFLFPVFNAVL